MPMDKSRYPPNWDEISRKVREEAGERCEACGVANGALIVRSTLNAARYLWVDEETMAHYDPANGEAIRMSELPDEFNNAKSKYTRVVLTVHHAGVDKPDGSAGDRHDKMDVRRENLQALCQRCHFLADLDIHQAKAKEARRLKQAERKAAAEVAEREQTVKRCGLLQLAMELDA